MGKNDIQDKVFLGNSKDVLKEIPNESVDLVVTSPPYFNLRNYQHKDQIGNEETPQKYIQSLIEIFRECKRVLKPTGSIWVNISDTYASGGGVSTDQGFIRNKKDYDNTKTAPKIDETFKGKLRSTMGKSLLGIPERFVIAMQDELNLIRRNTIIWYKPSCMPSSVKDRFTIDFEYFYFFTKNKEYYFETQYEPYKSLGQPDGIDRKIKGEVYTGKGQKDYESNNVQNIGDVKRRILESYKKKQIKYGSNKYTNNQDSVQNTTYSGNIWDPNSEGRIKRCVWSINTTNSFEKHFATFPEKLIETPIKACCPNHSGIVLDPFTGSGTTLIKARKMGRKFLGIEINEDYYKIINRRLNGMLESYC